MFQIHEHSANVLDIDVREPDDLVVF
jgi:hypothetical protein